MLDGASTIRLLCNRRISRLVRLPILAWIYYILLSFKISTLNLVPRLAKVGGISFKLFYEAERYCSLESLLIL